MNSLYEQMKPLPFVIFEIQDLSKKHNNSVILPPFQNIKDFSFVPSQTSLDKGTIETCFLVDLIELN